MTIVLVPTELNVIIKPIIKEKVTKSGLSISLSNKEKEATRGEVIAVGPGAYKENGIFVEPNVKVGEIVYFNPRVPEQIELDGEKYLITNCYNLLAKEDNV